MIYDEVSVKLIEASFTAEDYPDLMREPRYRRLQLAVGILEERIGREIDWRNITENVISKDSITIKIILE